MIDSKDIAVMLLTFTVVLLWWRLIVLAKRRSKDSKELRQTHNAWEVYSWHNGGKAVHVQVSKPTKPEVIKLKVFVVAQTYRQLDQHLKIYYQRMWTMPWHSTTVDHTMFVPLVKNEDVCGHVVHPDLEHRMIFLEGWELNKSPEFKARVRRLQRDVEFAERRRKEKTKPHVDPDVCQ